MMRIEFTEEEMQGLDQERKYHAHPRVRQRMETVYLKALDYPHQEIGRIVGISQKTLRSYLNMYVEGGILGLKQLNFRQPESALAAYRESLEAEFRARPVYDFKEAAERIEGLTGVKRSPDQVRRYLKDLGMRRLKVGQIPAKADPEAQADFLKKNSTHGLSRPKPVNANSSSSMPPTSFCSPFWGFFGVLPEFSSRPPAVANALTS